MNMNLDLLRTLLMKREEYMMMRDEVLRRIRPLDTIDLYENKHVAVDLYGSYLRIFMKTDKETYFVTMGEKNGEILISVSGGGVPIPFATDFKSLPKEIKDVIREMTENREIVRKIEKIINELDKEIEKYKIMLTTIEMLEK
jgi:hypothetical protein